MSEEPQIPEVVSIRTEALNAVLNYLASKPFIEVNDLINHVRNSISTLVDTETKPIPPKKPSKE